MDNILCLYVFPNVLEMLMDLLCELTLVKHTGVPGAIGIDWEVITIFNKEQVHLQWFWAVSFLSDVL